MKKPFVVLVICASASPTNASNIPELPTASRTKSSLSSLVSAKLPRGGDTNAAAVAPKKKKKRRKKKPIDGKEELSKTLSEKDSAQALGNAIRKDADILRSDLDKIDDSVSSVGYAMGASDYNRDIQEEGGGVEAAATSVLANYFLKSHGGAHALQCVCSSLATLAAFGTILLPTKSKLKLTCLKRSLQFAMTKHVSGLLAASTMAATAIPQVGLRKARVWMEKLSDDPVSQYLFYTALLLVWIPTSTGAEPWWWKPPIGKYSPLLLVGPILIREAISTLLVLSDVLVLLTTNQEQENASISSLLQVGQSVTNVVMSLLVTPSVWKNATPAKRQAVLAKLSSRICLALEVAVGVLLAADGLYALWEQSFGDNAKRANLLMVIKRMVCARLYMNYLWVKRRKVAKLAAQVRGGAAQLPMRVLNVILEPKASMGFTEGGTDDSVEADEDLSSWKDYARVGFGFS